jgi:hypothetical protein
LPLIIMVTGFCYTSSLYMLVSWFWGNLGEDWKLGYNLDSLIIFSAE